MCSYRFDVPVAAVFQEILHGRASLRRRELIRPALASLLGVIDEVCPVTLTVGSVARDLVLQHPAAKVRDAGSRRAVGEQQ